MFDLDVKAVLAQNEKDHDGFERCSELKEISTTKDGSESLKSNTKNTRMRSESHLFILSVDSSSSLQSSKAVIDLSCRPHQDTQSKNQQ